VVLLIQLKSEEATLGGGAVSGGNEEATSRCTYEVGQDKEDALLDSI